MIFNASQLLESAVEVQGRVDGVYIKVVQHYTRSPTTHSHYTRTNDTIALCTLCASNMVMMENVKIHVDI